MSCTLPPAHRRLQASRKKKSFLLRLDPAVASAIESLAAQELRSVNGQIEWLLREGLKRRGRELRVTTRTNNRRQTEDS